MSKQMVISSDDVLDEYDCHCRVSAGPGAGKTYWLTNHIRNVVTRSKRLSATRYIACISYTNVAADEIKERLGDYANRVEISTIHAFLYKFVVKPYLHLVTDDDGIPLVDYKKVDGHDEHRPSRKLVRMWLKGTGDWGPLCSKLDECCQYLKKIKWLINDDGEWYLGTIGYVGRPDYFPSSKLDSYKPLYWERGIIDHEDVLYFAYRILDEHPQIKKFLSARFPYLFVDEFQDTNPVQTQVLKWLAGENSYVGVIGDLEQSIYSFQGAKPEDFIEFEVANLQDYVIHDNHRSTDSIIRLLNHVRTDGMNQGGKRQEQGQEVRLYVGPLDRTISAIAEDLTPDENVCILARSNSEVENIRKSNYEDSDDVWSELEQIDLNRSRFLEDVMTAVELAKRGMLTHSLSKFKRILRIFHSDGTLCDPFRLSDTNMRIDDTIKRSISVSMLTSILSEYNSMQEKTLLEAYEFISDVLDRSITGFSLQRITKGRIKEFAEERKYSEFTHSVKLPASEKRNIRTIHQAKSAEFGNVLVAFNHLDLDKAAKQTMYLLRPTEHENCEEKRILYVALSRARDRLFISVSDFSKEDEQDAQTLGIQVVRT
jgi:DNA helicase-2/ATP-dependent DNA helicase PcrA